MQSTNNQEGGPGALDLVILQSTPGTSALRRIHTRIRADGQQRGWIWTSLKASICNSVVYPMVYASLVIYKVVYIGGISHPGLLFVI